MMIGPRQPPEPARLEHVQRRQRRSHEPEERSYHADETIGADPVDRPITVEKVRSIASDGFPLWESLEVMQLRNRRITVAYSDLSERLARLLAAGDQGWDANWCTYAAWSSKTIGTWIEHDPVPYAVRSLRCTPTIIKHGVLRCCQYLLRRDDGASYRALAAGNRFVFLEIGLAVASFIETFSGIDRETEPDEAAWVGYWDHVQGILTDLTQLDPSWLLTDAPEPADLRLGLHQYYKALFTQDRQTRAELILAGNLLIGAYEQRRVDGYLAASLALFTKRAMRALVRHRTGKLRRGRLRRWLTSVYGRMSTCGLVLKTHDERLRIGKPLDPPPGSDTALFPRDLDAVTTPLLQALLTRYDLSDGRHRRRRGRNWVSYDDRMSYITNLFRSRQQHMPLFVAPFEAHVEEMLLEGRLDPGALVPLPDGH